LKGPRRFVIVLDYDPDDVIDEHYEGGKGCHEVQLRSATAVGVHTGTNVAVGDVTVEVTDLGARPSCGRPPRVMSATWPVITTLRSARREHP
jgi:hypothetical protein